MRRILAGDISGMLVQEMRDVEAMPNQSPFADNNPDVIETERRRESDRQRMFELARRLREAARDSHQAAA